MRSLFDKIWDAHVVEELPGGNALVFMDRVVAHEITTPQGAIAIEKEYGDRLYDRNRIVAVNDHVAPAKDTATAIQAQVLRTWAKRQGIRLYDIGDGGICHVIVPERGYVTPGSTVCCGDSHTCTLGAFGAFALGIGTSAQAGAMLAGCLILQRPKVMRVEVTGELHPSASAKDLALAVIAQIGFRGGTGYVLEYTGSALDSLDMEQRMTLCNMAIEAGATTGIIAADGVTAAYLEKTQEAPSDWLYLRADRDARYAARITIDGDAVRPLVTWGTNPGENVPIDGVVPVGAAASSLDYDRHAGIAGRQTRGRTRRAARYLPRRGCPLDAFIVRSVPGHVDGCARAGDALHLLIESQFSRPHGRRRTRASRIPRDRRGKRSARPHRIACRHRRGHSRGSTRMMVSGQPLPLRRANVDTDQIIPARYLTGIDTEGLGEHLFTGMRGGAALLAESPGATIVVAGENFGCGSSREHAAWALRARGFRAVIASSFARIFLENAYTNAIVPVVVPDAMIEEFACARSIAIDVARQTVRADDAAPVSFELDQLRKQFILGGGFLPYLAGKIDAVRAWEHAR